MRIWTSSGHSVLALERWSNSRKRLVLTAINTSVTEPHWSSVDWLCSSWCTAVILGSPFPLIPEALFVLSCVGSLVSYCLVFSSFLIILFMLLLITPCLWGKFLELVQEWKYLYYILTLTEKCIIALLTSRFHSYSWGVRSLSDSSAFILGCLFIFLERLWNLCTWCSKIHHYLSWCGSVFAHCSGPRQALLISQLTSFSFAKFMWIISLMLFLPLSPCSALFDSIVWLSEFLD